MFLGRGVFRGYMRLVVLHVLRAVSVFIIVCNVHIH